MTTFESKPSTIEAVQWKGDNDADMHTFGEGKVRVSATLDSEHGSSPKSLELLAGKDGAQEWVPVPVGHWLVNQPGDKSDIWPVDPVYFAVKYQAAERRVFDRSPSHPISCQCDDCRGSKSHD